VLTVATEAALLLHVPPEPVVVKVAVEPTQSADAPEIVGGALIRLDTLLSTCPYVGLEALLSISKTTARRCEGTQEPGIDIEEKE
jgi:hypothetical protein